MEESREVDVVAVFVIHVVAVRGMMVVAVVVVATKGGADEGVETWLDWAMPPGGPQGSVPPEHPRSTVAGRVMLVLDLRPGVGLPRYRMSPDTHCYRWHSSSAAPRSGPVHYHR